MDKYVLKPLQWDTDFFGVKSAKITLNGELNGQEVKNMLEEAKEYGFVTIENICGAYSNDYYLGKLSEAYITDCPMTLKKETRPYDADAYNGVVIRPAEESDLSVLTEIARNAFTISRFFNDPEIDNGKAGELYTCWIKNSLKSADKKVFTTDDNSGFIICSENNEGDGVINLIATGATARNRGIGSALVRFADNWAYECGCKNIYVGTQSTNIPAINLYVKNGFKVFRTTRTYHLRNY